MKIVDKMPSRGSFVAVWPLGESLCCLSFEWDGFQLLVFDQYEEELSPYGSPSELIKENGIKYIVKD